MTLAALEALLIVLIVAVAVCVYLWLARPDSAGDLTESSEGLDTNEPGAH